MDLLYPVMYKRFGIFHIAGCVEKMYVTTGKTSFMRHRKFPGYEFLWLRFSLVCRREEKSTNRKSMSQAKLNITIYKT